MERVVPVTYPPGVNQGGDCAENYLVEALYFQCD